MTAPAHPANFSTYAVADLLDAFASNEPAPGGGSASALAGAMGVSLLIMAARVARTRRGTPEEVADLSEAAARLQPMRETLQELVDRDSAAYQAVVAAYRRPRGADEERAVRERAVVDALVGATNTPLDMMRQCVRALDISVEVAEKCVSTACSDVGVAIELLLAATRGAGLSVDANIGSIQNAQFVERARAEREDLEADAVAIATRARRLLPQR